MMSHTGKRLALAFSLLFIFTFANAQVSKEGKKKYAQFCQLRDMSDTSTIFADSALSVGLNIFQAELKLKDKKLDTFFLGSLAFDLAKLFENKYDYTLANEYYKLSGSCYEKVGELLLSGKSMSHYLFTYAVVQEMRWMTDAWGSSDSSIFSRGKKDTAIWLTVPSKSMYKSATGDTLFVEVQAGRAQGIKENSKFDVFTTFDTFENIKRPIVLSGTGFITEIKDFTSIGYIVLDATFMDTIYDKDAFEVKVFTDKEFVAGQFAQLGAYNIKLRNHLSNVYYSAGDGNLTISSLRYDLPLKLAMQADLKAAADYYNDMDSTVLQQKITSGRFKNYSYAQCLNQATIFDLEMFLDYVISYPAKYINREWNMADVFATWAINDCPTGNSEIRILDSIFLMDKNELMKHPLEWAGYYSAVGYADSLFLDKVNKDLEFDDAKRWDQLEKMQHLSASQNLYKSDSFYSVRLIFESFTNHKYKEGIAWADRVWPVLKDRQKMLVALYKGILHSQLNQNEIAIQFLDTALEIDSNYYYARGYKGWNLIKVGRAKQAFGHCLFAQQWDSFVTWTNINLAHALYLRGQKAEANRLYTKSFEFMKAESGFYTGLLSDFDYFINNGLNEEEFKALKNYYTDYYIHNWKYRIIGDSLKELGIKLRDKVSHIEAISLFKQSTVEYLKAEKTDWERVRSSYRYTAYSYYKLEDYQTSLVYYKKASDITLTHGLGEDNLASDYDDISNLYDWLSDTLRKMEYRTRASSLEVSLREKRDPKKLFMLVVGPPSSGKNDSFAIADAQAFSNKLRNSAELHFDDVTDETLTGQNATVDNVKKALDSAIYSLGENDVFLFYFTGYARNTYSEALQLSDGYFPVNDLFGYLGQIGAGRQVHIADCNGVNWREWYQRGNISLLANEKRSLVFMGLKNSRIEDLKTGHSALNSALLKSFDICAADGTVTATEWVSNAAMDLFQTDQLYAVEMQTFGHDFVIGKEKVVLHEKDTFAPIIELFGATQTRGENISLVSGKGVGAGRIQDNSRVVFAAANGFTLTLAANGRFELPKELHGVKNIHIEAVDEFGNRGHRDFLVSQVENTSSNEGTKYAYLFASGDYKYWPDLENPIFDARSIEAILETNYGYKVSVVEDPSKMLITEKLDYLRRFNFKPNDQLFVFFAGHGLHDSIWGGYYVCPESKLQADDKYFETYYPQQRIAELLDGCRAKNVFLVMDVCFGGKMFDKHDKHEYRSVNDGNEISTENFIQRQLEIPCRQFLTSGGNNYVADGVAGSHSPFALRFLTALEEAATGKEYITASQVMGYLWTMNTLGNDKKSLPRYGFFGGDKDGEYVLKVTRKIMNSAAIAGI